MAISLTWVTTCRRNGRIVVAADQAPRRLPGAHRGGGNDKEILLAESAEMVAYPYGNRFIYGQVLDDMDVERFQFSPDVRPGLIVQYLFKNTSDRARTVALSMVRQNRSAPRLVCGSSRNPRWSGSSSSGAPNDGVFVARDTDHPWFCVWGALPSDGCATNRASTCRSARTAAASRPRPVTRSRSAHMPRPR